MINAEAQLMQQRANEFLMADPDTQAETIMEAEQELPPANNPELAPTI